jgi:hypothetical protein
MPATRSTPGSVGVGGATPQAFGSLVIDYENPEYEFPPPRYPARALTESDVR